MTTRVRAFVALELPKDMRERMSELSTRLRPQLDRASWVGSENIHVTLRFLGESAPEQLERFTCELAAAIGALPAFESRFARLGVFPGTKNARVLWVGPAPEDPFLSLHAAVEDVARATGYAPEKQRFHPHATLARFRVPPSRDILRSALDEFSAFDGGTMPVDRVTLFRSDLQPNGALYTALHTFPLRESNS